MVTAILPAIPAGRKEDQSAAIGQTFSPSTASDSTVAPRDSPDPAVGRSNYAQTFTTPTRLAGATGLATGFGALIALLGFLRLPFVIEEMGADPSQALTYTYYLVGAMAIILSVVCFFGLRHLRGEDGKGCKIFVRGRLEPIGVFRHSYKLLEAVKLGFKIPSLGLAYLGGFVARASSVGISTFIPLFVNTYYISSGFCDANGHDLKDVKERCRDAYLLSAQLTGVSQTAALLFALIFGYCADNWRRSNISLIIAALAGFVGYIALAILDSPKTNGQDGTPFVYLIMVMLGVGQIGAIVCSLGLLGRCVLGMGNDHTQSVRPLHASSDSEISHVNGNRAEESATLLPKAGARQSYENMKGTIAGVGLFLGKYLSFGSQYLP